RPVLRVLRDEILARQDVTLVDVRSPAEFVGEVLAPAHMPQEQPQVPGHIPGAHNIPWSKAANEDGSFKAADELTALYHHARAPPLRGGLVLPDGRPVCAHVARAHRTARLPNRAQLRRLVDRVRKPGRRAGRDRIADHLPVGAACLTPLHAVPTTPMGSVNAK